ncbi:MAG TPA: hypothetical protein VI434_02435 [Candidatus Dormibacteraeota bacterium]
MKLTTVIGTAIAIVGLAACGSTVTPTARPTMATVALTPAPTAAPTPTATPAPSATPTPPPVLTETCDGSAKAESAGSVSFTDDTPGFDFVAYGPGLQGGWAGAATSDAKGDGTVSGLVTGDYEFNNFAPADSPGTLTGSFTIVACPTPLTITTTCSSHNVGPSGNGSVTFSGLTVGDDLNIAFTGAVPITSSTEMFPGQAGPQTETYAETNGDITVASGTFTVAACPG